MRAYRIVKKEENPTIQLNKVNLYNGFIIVTSDSETIGIIVYDDELHEFLFIDSFINSFGTGIDPSYHRDELEDLMKDIKESFVDPIEFNFIPVEK